MPEQIPWYLDLRWIITTIVALWGAGLASYQALEKQREAEDRRKAKEANIRVAFWPSAGGPINGAATEHHLHIKVKNLGAIDVWFKPACCSIVTEPLDEHFILPDTTADVTFPYVLKPGDSFTVVVEAIQFYQWVWEEGMEMLPRMKAVVADALGREFSSDWRQFNWIPADPPA